MPPKMVDIMKKCWSAHVNFRPRARDLDATFMDMGVQDTEPIAKELKGGALNRTQRATGDSKHFSRCQILIDLMMQI